MHAKLGHLIEGVTFKDIDVIFKSAACGGAITNDIIADQDLLKTPDARQSVKAHRICFLGEREVVAEVLDEKSRIQLHRLGDEKTEQATGLPMAIQQVLKQDLKDYFDLTKCYTTTHLYAGNPLDTPWTLAVGAKNSPLMVRDLSGHGLVIVTPHIGHEADLDLYAGPQGQGLYAAEFNIRRLESEGKLIVKTQPAGSRLFQNDTLLTRENTLPEPNEGQLRAYTGIYDYSAR